MRGPDSERARQDRIATGSRATFNEPPRRFAAPRLGPRRGSRTGYMFAIDSPTRAQ